MKPTEEIFEDVPILRMAAEGKCIAKINGQVIFTENVAPGDIVDLKILKRKKKYLLASPIKIKSYSKQRSEPFCQHFGICGGCKWQHVNYQTQLEYKQQQVVDALERIGKLDLPVIQPIIPSEKTTYYRNKLEYTFSSHRWLTKEEIDSDSKFNRDALGFHIPGRYDKILNIETCYLQEQPFDIIRNRIREFAMEHNYDFFHPYKLRGELRNLIIRNSNQGEIMVIIQFAQIEKERINLMMNFIKDEFPEINSLNYIINTKKNDSYFDLPIVTFSGKSYITENLGTLKFRLGPKSFYQTNSLQAARLYEITRDFAGFSGKEIVYDLYTGIGSIANFIADKVKSVVGIDYIKMSIIEARANAKLNNINNTKFLAGDIKGTLSEDVIEKNGSPDVIITDPPRVGMHRNVVRTILEIKPQKIVYISCNPATQARDIEMMKRDYVINKVQPLDMFPHTHHVENIVLLIRKDD